MKTRAMAVLAFVLVFAAGVGVGMLIPWPQDRNGGGHRGGPMAELDLTRPQRDQMKQIWSEETGQAMRESDQMRREAFEARREAVQALLTEEQQAEYAQIHRVFEEQMKASHEARRAAFDRANARTREILTSDQREQYDAWLEKRRDQFERGRSRGPRDGDDRGRWRGWRGGGGESTGRPQAAPVPEHDGEAEAEDAI